MHVLVNSLLSSMRLLNTTWKWFRTTRYKPKAYFLHSLSYYQLLALSNGFVSWMQILVFFQSTALTKFMSLLFNQAGIEVLEMHGRRGQVQLSSIFFFLLLLLLLLSVGPQRAAAHRKDEWFLREASYWYYDFFLFVNKKIRARVQERLISSGTWER